MGRGVAEQEQEREQAVGDRRERDRRQSDPHLLEREAEQKVLRRVIRDAAGGAGGAVLLSGPAGIGKTELVRAALADARAAGFATVLARASEFERGFAFGVVRQLLEPLVAAVPPGARAGLFSGAAALALRPLDPSAVEELETPASDYGTLHGLYWLSVNLSDRAPLAVAVDDVQWADAASLRWIAFLARRLEGLPLALFMTVRSDEAAPQSAPLEDLLVNGPARSMRPPSLSLAATRELVRRELAGEPAGRFVEACHMGTGGNPLFLRELLASLREQGVRPDEGESGRVEEVGPKAVARLVVARLAALGPEAQRLARSAAVLGDGADTELARELAGLTPAQAVDAGHRLAHADLVTLERRVDFVHPVSRAAIVVSLDPRERAALNREAVGLRLRHGDPEAAASHLLALPPAGDAQTVQILREAAGHARARGAPEAAVTLLERALTEPPGESVHVEVLHELGLAELRVRAGVAPVHLRAAFEAAPAGPSRARVADDLAHALNNLNRTEEGVAVLEAALAELDSDEAELRSGLAVRLVELARLAPSRVAILERVRTELERVVEGPLARRLLAFQAFDAFLEGRPAPEVAELADRALDGGRLAAETAEGSLPAFLAVLARARADGLDYADEELERVVEQARGRGSVVSYTGALSVRARLRLMRGDLGGAETDAHEIEELGDEGLGRDFVLGSLLDSLVDQGRLDEAGAVLPGSVLAGEVPMLQVLSPGLHARGRLRLAQGRVEEGLADVLRCGDLQEASGARNPADVPWRGTAALALLERGDVSEAGRLSAEELELARAFGAPATVGAALRVRGLVVGGGEGLELLREAVQVLEPSAARLDLARALVDLGHALREHDDSVAARGPLSRGRELAVACGATPLAQHALRETLAAGGRPRRAKVRGVDALTTGERRTAELAARGMRNREIAQALFVTEKTVEGHLSRAFRKLGVESRVELATSMGEDG